MKEVIKKKISGYDVEESCSDSSRIRFMAEFQQKLSETYDELHTEKENGEIESDK